MSRSTICPKYWSQLINHEISTISGIRWYIAYLLMHCGLVSSVNQVVKSNHSEFLTSYVDNKAIHIYQTCYHDTRYYSFKIMDYDGPDSMRGLTGTILSYDNICNQYNVVINIIRNSAMAEHWCALSPSVMEPVNLLPNKMNWSSYHLSRDLKKSRADVVKLNLPCQTVEQKSLPTLPHVTDLRSMLKFWYELFELLRRKFPQPEQSANGVSDKELMRELQ